MASKHNGRNKNKQVLNDKLSCIKSVLDSKALPVENEIDMLRSFKSKIISKYNRGKKLYATIDGQKVWISADAVNVYRTICKMISERELVLKKKVSKVVKEHLSERTEGVKLYNRLVKQLKDIEPAIYRSPALSENYATIKEKLNDPRIDTPAKNNMMREFINQNIIIINFLNGKIKRDVEEIKPIDEVVFDDSKQDDNSRVANRSKHESSLGTKYSSVKKSKTKLQREKKPKKGKIAEKKEKKPGKFRSIFKRVAAAAAAAVVLLCGSLIAKNASAPAKESLKGVSVTTPTEENTTEPTTYAKKVASDNNSSKMKATQGAVTVTKKSKSTSTKSKVKKQVVKKNKVKKSKISVKSNIKHYLGKRIKLKKESKIYGNAVSAARQENGYNPSYSYTDSRKIVGCGVRCGSDLTTFVEVSDGEYEVVNNNHEAYMSKTEADHLMQTLLKNGGKIESVASRDMRTSQGVEGFYNYDDVKVLKKSI